MQKFSIVALVVIPLWWVFVVIWQPVVVHMLANLSYRFSSLSVTREEAQAARERALSYATIGGVREQDVFFTKDEVSHLIDVSILYRPIFAILNIASASSWIILIAAAGKKQLYPSLFRSASTVLLTILLLGLVSLLFFPYFFDAFHRLLFPQGNWAFPEGSLLIAIFPELFWKLMLGSIVLLLGLVALVYWLLGAHTVS